MIGIFAAFFAASLLFVIYYLLKLRLNYWKNKNVVHPPSLPILGNYGEYILLKKYVGHVLQDICSKFPNAPYIGVLYGTEPTLIVQDPEFIKLIMTKDFYYFSGREISKYTHHETFTTNIFFSGGDRWKVTRQNLTPLFSSSKMKTMFYLLEKSSLDFESMLATEMQGNQIEARNLMARYTISGIGSCGFGIDMHTLDSNSENNIFLQIGNSVFEGTNYRGFKTVARSIWPALFYGLGFKSFPKTIDDFFSKLLIAVFRERGNKPSSRNDFVDLILSFNENKYITGDSLSNMKDGGSQKAKVLVDNKFLVAQCLTMFVAGFETSATTLSFTLYELAKNQDAQKRAQEEVDAYLKRQGNRLTYECVKELSYLDACVHETLRLYPVVGMLTREVVEEYTLPSGLMLEKGLRIHLPVYYLHHHPDYFPDPEEYKPERFLPENKHHIKPYTYLPFGEGPRVCIGSRFAKLQVMCGLITFLKRYHVQLAEDMPVRVPLEPRSLVTQAVGGIRLKTQERPGWEQRIFVKS